MKLYVISQSKNEGYDTYDSAVVCAKSASDARKIHPQGGVNGGKDIYTWAPPHRVDVECIGIAKRGTKRGVIVASFNAG